MHKLKLALIASTLVLSAGASQAEDLVFTLKNGTNSVLNNFHASPVGVDEDPVTGSAHTELTPYWAERLGRTSLVARQISKRGGHLLCRLDGDRVRMAGFVTPYLEGTIELPDTV